MTQAKQNAKERDNYECQFCGLTQAEHRQEDGSGLHAHHIIKSGDGGKDAPENYITVCRDCHNTLENTQADALIRIKEKHVQEAKQEHEVRIDYLKDKIRELSEVVHGLERGRKDKIKDAIQNEYVTFHLVSAIMKAEASATSDREKALEWYDDWGYKMKRSRAKVSEKDAEELAEKVAEELR